MIVANKGNESLNGNDSEKVRVTESKMGLGKAEIWLESRFDGITNQNAYSENTGGGTAAFSVLPWAILSNIVPFLS